LLKVEVVDLNQGVLSIRRSKGNSQHFVVLHDTMLDLMKKYDYAIQKYHPNHIYFFASPSGSHYSSAWHEMSFREFWDRVNSQMQQLMNSAITTQHKTLTNISEMVSISIPNFYI